MSAFLLAIALLGSPSVHPWPIGPGPRYTPPARTAAVAAGKPVGSLTCGPAGTSFRLHLELFAGRKVIVVPAGIGAASSGCVYPVRTTEPGGIVRVATGRSLTLGDLFRIWGQPLDAHHLASFTSQTPRPRVPGRPSRPRPARRDPAHPPCRDRARARPLPRPPLLLPVRRR